MFQILGYKVCKYYVNCLAMNTHTFYELITLLLYTYFHPYFIPQRFFTFLAFSTSMSQDILISFPEILSHNHFISRPYQFLTNFS